MGRIGKRDKRNRGVKKPGFFTKMSMMMQKLSHGSRFLGFLVLGKGAIASQQLSHRSRFLGWSKKPRDYLIISGYLNISPTREHWSMDSSLQFLRVFRLPEWRSLGKILGVDITVDFFHTCQSFL
jgi:hypothetical protein